MQCLACAIEILLSNRIKRNLNDPTFSTACFENDNLKALRNKYLIAYRRFKLSWCRLLVFFQLDFEWMETIKIEFYKSSPLICRNRKI